MWNCKRHHISFLFSNTTITPNAHILKGRIAFEKDFMRYKMSQYFSIITSRPFPDIAYPLPGINMSHKSQTHMSLLLTCTWRTVNVRWRKRWHGRTSEAHYPPPSNIRTGYPGMNYARPWKLRRKGDEMKDETRRLGFELNTFQVCGQMYCQRWPWPVLPIEVSVI